MRSVAAPYFETCSPPAPPPPMVPPSSVKKPILGKVGIKNVAILDMGRQVSNLNNGKTHLWRDGLKTVCRSWECGAPENSTPFAKFMGVGVFIPDNAITPQCRICFSDKLKFLRVPPAELKTGDPASSSGSDDDSSVTSESMESDDAPGVVPVTKDEVIDSSEDDKPLRGIWDCTMHFLRDDHRLGSGFVLPACVWVFAGRTGDARNPLFTSV